MSHFGFLGDEWPEAHAAAVRAEALAYPDPRASCFYARRSMELAVRWLFEHDCELKLPYKDDLSALIHEPTFKQVVGPALFTKIDLIRRYGNQTVHSKAPIMSGDATVVVRELLHFGYWLASLPRITRMPSSLLSASQAAPQ